MLNIKQAVMDIIGSEWSDRSGAFSKSLQKIPLLRGIYIESNNFASFFYPDGILK